MTKKEFNRVMSILCKQRYSLRYTGIYDRITNHYSVFVDCDGSSWNERGYCVDEEWQVELTYKPLGFEDDLSAKDYFTRFLLPILISEHIDWYCLNPNNFETIEID